MIVVKVQFGGLKLYKEIQGINQEESHLLKIFRLSSLNKHTFLHIYIAL